MIFSFVRTAQFDRWFGDQSPRDQALIVDRLSRIEQSGHFGKVRHLGDGLWELKFNDGTRIYYARTGQKELTLLLGGSKHGQDKDIKKAKKILG